MSGIEVVGVVLAVLPFIVNQLDNYVQGCKTLTMLKRDKFFYYLREYMMNLSTQQTRLQNTLELLLGDIVQNNYQLSELVNHPQGTLWEDPLIREKLRHKLGGDYDDFIGSMVELCDSLQKLRQEFTLELSVIGKVSLNKATMFERMKFIFSKSMYKDLLVRMNITNDYLESITQYASHQGPARRKQSISTASLLRLKAARRSAKSLYNAIIRGSCWKCPCKDKHSIYFQLDSNGIENPEMSTHGNRSLTYRLLVGLNVTQAFADDSSAWKEIEAECCTIEAPTMRLPDCIALAGPEDTTTFSHKRRKVAGYATLAYGLETRICSNYPPQVPPSYSPIFDMCDTLNATSEKPRQREAIGFITDDIERAYQHQIYLLNTTTTPQRFQSLKDILTSIPNFSKPHPLSTKLGRLYLAVNLACSVLQVDGSWLRSNWTTKDILFNASPPIQTSKSKRPYLLLQLPRSTEGLAAMGQPSLQVCQTTANQTLFSIGVALTELSLGRKLCELETAPSESLIRGIFKGASRHLHAVYGESGERYGDVVKQCLFWSVPQDTTLDDEWFHDTVLHSIITPLVETLRDFEGHFHSS